MKKKRSHGGITRQWLLSIGGAEKDGYVQFQSTKDQFGHWAFCVVPNETGSATIRGWHFPEGGGLIDLKDQHAPTRQKLLDLFATMKVKHRPTD